jgi:cobalt-precorrin 5A hydrolase/precorrin-3B C17-methyltransferase
VIEQAIQQVFQAYHLVETAIAGIATLDLKANEIGLVEFCRDRSLPFIGFSASALQAIAVPSPSPLVASTTRTPSVAEAAALQAASQFSIPLSLLPLDSEPPNSEPPNSEPPNLQPPTPNPPSLLVPKQIFRFPNYSGAVTIAVAQAQQEYLEKHK